MKPATLLQEPDRGDLVALDLIDRHHAELGTGSRSHLFVVDDAIALHDPCDDADLQVRLTLEEFAAQRSRMASASEADTFVGKVVTA